MTASKPPSQATVYFWFPLAVVFLADLATKWAADALLSDKIELSPFLNLKLHYNYGISFGLLQATDPIARWTLTLGTAAVATVVLALGYRETAKTDQLALSLVAGGALGNLVDRARDGRVTDFLDLHLSDWHWPLFNIADVAITIGMLALVWVNLRRPLAKQGGP